MNKIRASNPFIGLSFAIVGILILFFFFGIGIFSIYLYSGGFFSQGHSGGSFSQGYSGGSFNQGYSSDPYVTQEYNGNMREYNSVNNYISPSAASNSQAPYQKQPNAQYSHDLSITQNNEPKREYVMNNVQNSESNQQYVMNNEPKREYVMNNEPKREYVMNNEPSREHVVNNEPKSFDLRGKNILDFDIEIGKKRFKESKYKESATMRKPTYEEESDTYAYGKSNKRKPKYYEDEYEDTYKNSDSSIWSKIKSLFGLDHNESYKLKGKIKTKTDRSYPRKYSDDYPRKSRVYKDKYGRNSPKLIPIGEENIKINSQISEDIGVMSTDDRMRIEPIDDSVRIQPIDDRVRIQPIDDRMRIQPIDDRVRIQPQPQPIDDRMGIQPQPQPIDDRVGIQPQPIDDSMRVRAINDGIWEPIPTPVTGQPGPIDDGRRRRPIGEPISTPVTSPNRGDVGTSSFVNPNGNLNLGNVNTRAGRMMNMNCPLCNKH